MRLDIDNYVQEWIKWLESEIGVDVTLLGTGPEFEHMIDRRPYLKKIK